MEAGVLMAGVHGDGFECDSELQEQELASLITYNV